jgi:hypothetical protein
MASRSSLVATTDSQQCDCLEKSQFPLVLLIGQASQTARSNGIEPISLTYLKGIDMNWFRTSPNRSEDIQCPRCERTVVGCLPSGDHRPSSCPHCKALLIVFSMTAKNVAIDLDRSPRELQAVLNWMQTHFDELEFISLITAVEDLCDFVD